MFDDTGLNTAESLQTLLLQQKELTKGRRAVQMFPKWTPELELPDGMQRYVNARGVFHFNPAIVDEEYIEYFSSQLRENVFLRLGPYNKDDIIKRVFAGEKEVFITEYTPEGIEVRSAIGTVNTLEEQRRFFHETKEDGNYIEVGLPPQRIRHLMQDKSNGYESELQF